MRSSSFVGSRYMTIRKMQQDSFAVVCLAGVDYNTTGTRADPDHGYTHGAYE